MLAADKETWKEMMAEYVNKKYRGSSWKSTVVYSETNMQRFYLRKGRFYKLSPVFDQTGMRLARKEDES